MDQKKFKRSTNFTTKEDNILLSLVKKYRNEVECKKTDCNANKIKASAWLKIEEEFNMIGGEPYRDCKILRTKYENLKKRTKKKYADHKTYITTTGGGPSKDIMITSTDDDIHEIIGTQLTGLSSEFDDDAVMGKGI